MSRIKEKLLVCYTKQLAKRRSVLRTNVGFQQAHDIGILFNASTMQQYDAISRLVAQLEKLGKRVIGLCYATTPVVANSPFPIITDRDVKLWGTVAHPQAKVFIGTPFDYLYQLDLEGHPILDYLLAKSNAKCRVGHYSTARSNLFEIMITLSREQGKGSDVEVLIEQMLHYTQLLVAPQ